MRPCLIKKKKEKFQMLNPWQCVSVCVSCLWDEHLPHWSTPAVPWLSLESVQSLTFGAPAQSTFGQLQSWFPLSPPAARELSQSDTPLRVRLELRSLVSDPRGRARPEDHAPVTPLGRYDSTKNTPSSTCSALAPPPLPVNHCPLENSPPHTEHTPLPRPAPRSGEPITVSEWAEPTTGKPSNPESSQLQGSGWLFSPKRS